MCGIVGIFGHGVGTDLHIAPTLGDSSLKTAVKREVDTLSENMVISLERTREQAEQFGHSLEREVCYLAVHSVLHLLGYDHMDDGPMKAQMRAREEAILGELGITRE